MAYVVELSNRAKRDLAALSATRRITVQLEAHEGVILRINEQGLGIVKDTQSNQQFAFTFDKITGYRGESTRELGLVVGAHVQFNSTADHQVVSVQLLPRSASLSR